MGILPPYGGSEQMPKRKILDMLARTRTALGR